MNESLIPIGYHRILRILYGNNISMIIELLNASIYVTNFQYEKKSTVIHTGVSFFTQTGQEMDTFYDFFSKKIIVQPRNTKSDLALPKINGLTVKTGGSYDPAYFNTVLPLFFCEYLYKKEEYFTVYAFDTSRIRTLWNKSDIKNLVLHDKDNSKIKIKNIKVFIDKKSKGTKEVYPLNRTIEHVINLNPNGWIYKCN